MRAPPILLLIMLLLMPAALVEAGPTEGPRLTTDRQVYFYLTTSGAETAEITFSNSGTDAVFLPNMLPLRVLREGEVVFEAGAIQLVREVAPGESVTFSWDFQTSCRLDVLRSTACAGFATPGEYLIEWDYGRTPTLEQLSTVTTGFRISLDGAP